MCGIAGYSLRSRSGIERTLAAQALLAGIAERGADAVGYAYRAPGEAYPTVVKQRTPASELIRRISVPDAAHHLLVHVRDYTKGHPSIAANNPRTTSTIRSNASAVAGVIGFAPSRNRDNNDSPTCVTRSNRPNAKNPDVPLIV